MKQIAIIGAGAAGLMTAATILENSTGDYHIHLFEKNPSPGKKVIISGGGRCNLTTGIIDKKDLLSRYTRGSDFIKKAFGKFGPKKCFEWFETHDVPLKIQEDLRVFPCSDKGEDIVKVFGDIFEKYSKYITLHYSEGIENINKKEELYIISTQKNIYNCDIVVISTGGNAYSHTGSTGDGYAFARELGHSVTKLGPSLSSFLTEESWLHDLSGLVFENAEIRFFVENMDIQIQLTGPLLLTHFGISGPLTFKVSSHLAFETISPSSKKIIHFSPLAEMNLIAWENFLKESFLAHPKKNILSILSEKLSRRFAISFIDIYFPHIRETFAASISKIDRENISKLLGNGIPITLLERRPGDEFVTAGGIETSEIESESMESKLQKNLYFAGEILNVDGYTGGFSLQICWASGYSAGMDISKKITHSTN